MLPSALKKSTGTGNGERQQGQAIGAGNRRQQTQEKAAASHIDTLSISPMNKQQGQAIVIGNRDRQYSRGWQRRKQTTGKGSSKP
jgi:hypothetical protein